MYNKKNEGTGINVDIDYIMINPFRKVFDLFLIFYLAVLWVCRRSIPLQPPGAQQPRRETARQNVGSELHIHYKVALY